MVVVTLTDIVGHAPQDVGARMIVGKDEVLFGTVGGGKIEKRCIDTAREFLAAKEKVASRSFTWNLPRDIGMTCGGEVTFFFETYRPESTWKIAVFGAGHVSQELTRLLVRMDCQVTVVDPRSEWIDKLPNVSNLRKLVKENMIDALEVLEPDTFVVIVTMGHATDVPLLKWSLKNRSFPYVGVIGSKVKRVKINAELRDDGVNPTLIESFHCPMGEPFGRNTPFEMSMSIIAQLLKVRDQV